MGNKVPDTSALLKQATEDERIALILFASTELSLRREIIKSAVIK